MNCVVFFTIGRSFAVMNLGVYDERFKGGV